MSEKRKSIFLTQAERLCERVGIERLPHTLGRWYAKGEACYRESLCGTLSDDGFDRSSWQFRLRVAGMRMREQSCLMRARRCFFSYLLESRVSYVGLWLLLSGLSLLITELIRGHGVAGGADTEACALLILLSLPLLGANVSLAATLSQSRMLRSFLFGFCDASPDVLGGGEAGMARPIGVLIGAALCALAGGFFGARGVVLLLFFLPCLVLLSEIPELSLLLLILAFPILQMSAHPTLYLCLLALLVHLSFLMKVYCGRRDFSVSACDVFVFLFCVLLLLGGLLSYGAPYEGMALSLLASLYFPSVHLLANARWRMRAVIALLLGCGVTSLLGIFQYFFGSTPLLWVDADRFSEIGRRVTGVFENPNVLGIYLLLLLPISFSLVLDVRGRGWGRILALCIFLFGVPCAVFTWSRGAWLAILLEIVLLLLFSGKRTAALCAYLPVLLIGAVPLLPQSVLQRFLSIGSLADSSIRYRLYTWRGVCRMISEHPFGIGVGESAFCTVYPQYAVSGIESVMHAHQVLLQIALEMGLGGVLVFFAAILLCIARGLRDRSTAGFAAALCGALAMGCFDHLWYEKTLIALIFILAALTAREEVTV